MPPDGAQDGVQVPFVERTCRYGETFGTGPGASAVDRAPAG